MQRLFYLILINFVLLLPLPLFAAGAGGGSGGGGGGSGSSLPECTTADWSCTPWNACTAQGQQTRTCFLQKSCLATLAAKPPEAQVCTPVTTPTPTKSSSAPSPSPVSSAPPPSTARTRLTPAPLPTPSTPSPTPSPQLRCGNLPDLPSRVTCRLNLTKEELAHELSLQYAPELCRAQKDKEEWKECVAIYRNLAPCWNEIDGVPRITCAKQIIGLPEDLRTAKQSCLSKNRATRTQCLAEFKEKVVWLMLFRMYNLEFKAEAMLADGASRDRVAEFDVQVEEHKIAFYKEGIPSVERKRLVQSLQAKWKLFLQNANTQKL